MNIITLPDPISCIKCGTYFSFTALPERRNDGADFWCPNGHVQHFTKLESQIQKERADAAESRLQNATNRIATLEVELHRAQRLLKRRPKP